MRLQGCSRLSDQAEPTPLDLQLDRHGGLAITWSDGLKATIPLGKLRAACPCAACRHERHEREQTSGGLPVLGASGSVASMSQVENAELVGHYALRIYWGDGHSTGIYDFRLLRELSRAAD